MSYVKPIRAHRRGVVPRKSLMGLHWTVVPFFEWALRTRVGIPWDAVMAVMEDPVSQNWRVWVQVPGLPEPNWDAILEEDWSPVEEGER